MEFGLSLKQKEGLISIFDKHLKQGKVIVYGSRAKGNFTPRSDLDLAIQSANADRHLLATIHADIMESDFPYLCDIQYLEEIKSPRLLDHIKRMGKTFYQKESGVMAGWKAVPLAQCIRRIDTPRKIPRKQFADSGRFPIVSQEQDLINGYWSDEVDVIHVEYPLVVFGDHTKILKYVDFDFIVGADGVKLLQPEAFLNSKYFYYFLMGHPVDSLGYARHFRLLKKLEIIFPKFLPEQQRIVAILDETFVAIETATANTKKNLANARELFESELNRVFQSPESAEDSRGGVITGWQTVKIMDVVERLTMVDPRKRPDESFEYIDVSSVSRTTYSIHAASTLLGCEAPSRARRLVQTGDVLFATVRPTLQRIAIVPDHLDQAVCSTGYFVLRPKPEVNGRFLFHYLFSRPFSDKMALLQRGASYPAVSDRDIKEHFIFLPSLTEQKKITAHLDKLSEKTQSLIGMYQTKLTALAELKQSLLHKAFTGELTAHPNAADRTFSDAGA